MSYGRQSELRIDCEGTWHYRGMEMCRRDIVRFLYQHLFKDSSGQFYVEIAEQRCEVDVEDTAYVVLAVSQSGHKGSDRRICLLLSDDTVEDLDPATLWIGKSNIPYCRVKSNCFDARFSTSSYYQLAELISHDPLRGRYYIQAGKSVYYIPDSQDGMTEEPF